MSEQLSFAALFEEAAFEQKTSHLPAAMAEALPFFRRLIERHHAAMIGADFVLAQAINDEAHDLAVKLNHGDPAILADDDSPGSVLENETRAPSGEIPLWGQVGDFIVEGKGMKARIEMEGIFGLAASPIPGFCAQAIEFDKPFLSETGFRSFLGERARPAKGMLPNEFAAAVIGAYLERRKARLFNIEDRYRSPG